MKVAIKKTREGNRSEIIDRYDSMKEAKQVLKRYWSNYKDKWDDISTFEGFSSNGKVLRCDVYCYEIVNIEDL